MRAPILARAVIDSPAGLRLLKCRIPPPDGASRFHTGTRFHTRFSRRITLDFVRCWYSYTSSRKTNNDNSGFLNYLLKKIIAFSPLELIAQRQRECEKTFLEKYPRSSKPVFSPYPIPRLKKTQIRLNCIVLYCIFIDYVGIHKRIRKQNKISNDN